MLYLHLFFYLNNSHQASLVLSLMYCVVLSIMILLFSSSYIQKNEFDGIVLRNYMIDVEYSTTLCKNWMFSIRFSTKLTEIYTLIQTHSSYWIFLILHILFSGSIATQSPVSLDHFWIWTSSKNPKIFLTVKQFLWVLYFWIQSFLFVVRLMDKSR